MLTTAPDHVRPAARALRDSARADRQRWAREPRGLRYLHCSLCECQWHKVRSTCSVCPQDEKVEYWSIDKSNAVVKAESCSYIILY